MALTAENESDRPDDVEDSLRRLSRRAWGALETLHVVGYFAPQTQQAYADIGLTFQRQGYFASRSAPMGPVDAALTVATFFVFSPALVGRALPSAWEIVTPEQVTQARQDSIAAVLHGVLGQPDVAEAVDLAQQVCAGLTAPGRPLYAAHAGLPWREEDPLLALWQAATLIREHRGDGHVSVLLAHDLDPVEALVLGGLFARNTEFVRTTRGWTDDEWAAGQDRLRARGLLDADGAMTPAGVSHRKGVERATDQLAMEGWRALGADGTARLLDLVSPLRDAVLASDVLPGWITGRR